MRKCDVCENEKDDVAKRDSNVYLCSQCYRMIKHWLGLSINEVKSLLTKVNMRNE